MRDLPASRHQPHNHLNISTLFLAKVAEQQSVLGTKFNCYPIESADYPLVSADSRKAKKPLPQAGEAFIGLKHSG
ncbi:hypothetical protein [Hymenobacter antarcticus]|uniref:hypothetical protein n=1 Tax=Hymenobacter antarcticus TaxID=486270 RepID=UPI0031F05F17